MYGKVVVWMFAIGLFAGSIAYTDPSPGADPKPTVPPKRTVFEFDLEGKQPDVQRFISDSRVPSRCKVQSIVPKDDTKKGAIWSVYYKCSDAKTTAVRKQIILAIKTILSEINTAAAGTIIIRVKPEDCSPQQCGEGSFNKLYLIDDPCAACILE